MVVRVVRFPDSYPMRANNTANSLIYRWVQNLSTLQRGGGERKGTIQPKVTEVYYQSTQCLPEA